MTIYRDVGSPFSADYVPQNGPLAFAEDFMSGGASLGLSGPADGFVALPERFKSWSPSGSLFPQQALDAQRQMGLIVVAPPQLGMENDWAGALCDVSALFPPSVVSVDPTLCSIYAKLSRVSQNNPALADLSGDSAEGISTYGGIMISTADLFPDGVTQDGPFISLGLRLGVEGYYATLSKWIGHQNLLESVEVLIGLLIGSLYVRLDLNFDEDDETVVSAQVSADGVAYSQLAAQTSDFFLPGQPKWLGFGATGNRNDGLEPPLTFGSSALVEFIRVTEIVPLTQSLSITASGPGGRAQQ